ncbi:hypothetical protein G9A89_015263 [Geosiphon pyriformis]|nr:hypothetical protein G9A89_015263 [Geosiphon pyriformis]
MDCDWCIRSCGRYVQNDDTIFCYFCRQQAEISDFSQCYSITLKVSVKEQRKSVHTSNDYDKWWSKFTNIGRNPKPIPSSPTSSDESTTFSPNICGPLVYQVNSDQESIYAKKNFNVFTTAAPIEIPKLSLSNSSYQTHNGTFGEQLFQQFE